MNPFFQKITNKIQNWDVAQECIKEWQLNEEKVVFTNGCFDLIHYGHLYYLAEAASLGHKLIVGLNSDASVKRLKGAHRPIKDNKSRMHLMASLQCVDLVVEFDEETPFNLIKALSPNVLVKGGDWSVDQIVGSDWVLKNGGKVLSLEFKEGFSTTNIEAKIIRYGNEISESK